MRAILCTVVLVLSTTLAGCAGSAVRALSSKPDQLATFDDGTLCQAYSLKKSDKVRAELQRRDALTADEWQAVDGGKIFVGMRYPALLCSWGAPDKTNMTTTEYGKSAQWVYGLFDVRRYVYLERGEVVAFQN